VLAAAGVPGPTVHAPEVVGYLRRFGFAFAFVGSAVEAATADRYLAMALDITIAEGHGGPRTCAGRPVRWCGCADRAAPGSM